jgi:hypothetical protein
MLLEISAARYSGAIEGRCEKVTPLGSMSPSRDFNVEMRVGGSASSYRFMETKGLSYHASQKDWSTRSHAKKRKGQIKLNTPHACLLIHPTFIDNYLVFCGVPSSFFYLQKHVERRSLTI